MGGTRLTMNNLEMPIDFPTADVEHVHTKLTPCFHTHRDHYGHFAGAWQALSYRYKAVAEYDELFAAAVIQYGPGPGPEERYMQERVLFGFFSNALSLFDAYCYAIFAIGAIIKPLEFRLSSAADERNVSIKSTLSAYQKSFPGCPLGQAVNALKTDAAYASLSNIRNILNHRGTPPRSHSLTIQIGLGAEQKSSIPKFGLTLNHTSTSSYRKEVSRMLSAAVRAAGRFVDEQFR
jgi:hypothetical protein